MEELLKTVTSVRKEFQERRVSRLKQHSESLLLSNLPPPSPSLGLPLQSSLSNSNLSKVSVDKPPKVPYAKLIASKSVKVLQHSNKSQPQHRSYKLDAAEMLASRIKGLLRKQFALLVKNIAKNQNLDKLQQDSRKLVFKLNLSNLQEKKRYVSREKCYDEDFFQKLSTSRVFDRSPCRIDIPEIEPVNTCRESERPISDLLDDIRSIRVSRLRDGIEKGIPGSTRAPSVYSQKGFEQHLAHKPKLELLEKMAENFLRNLRQAYISLKGYTKIEEVQNLKVQRLNFASKRLASTQRNSDVYKGAILIKKVYTNKVSEIFYFMKFRYVIESAFMEDSSAAFSSQECFKECLVEMRRDSVINVSKNNVDNNVSAIFLEQFCNLMSNVEKSVSARYLTHIMSVIVQENAACERFAKSINCRVNQIKEASFISLKNYKKVNTRIKKSIKSFVFIICRDLRHRVISCFKCWKSNTIGYLNENAMLLKAVTLATILKSQVKGKFRILIANCLAMNRIAATHPLKNRANAYRALYRLIKHFKFVQKCIFFRWKISIRIPNFKQFYTKNLFESLNKVIVGRVSLPFNFWRIRVKIFHGIKKISIKTIAETFKHRLLIVFNEWKIILNDQP